jgi:hypothetical protein
MKTPNAAAPRPAPYTRIFSSISEKSGRNVVGDESPRQPFPREEQ